MKIKDVTKEGFYWHRTDKFRPWAMIFIGREAMNPLHPRYENFVIEGSMHGERSRSSSQGAGSVLYKEHEVIGPIIPPSI